MQKGLKKILIFHPYLAPYRIDLYNKLAEDYEIFVLLTGSKKEISTLGFDLESVNQQAKFAYQYITNGIRFGRHLISSIFLKIIQQFNPDIIISHELGINTIFAILGRVVCKKKYKIYTTIDDSPSMAENYSKKRELLRRFVANHVNGFIVVNPNVKIFLEEKYKRIKNKTIYFPIIQDDNILINKINLSQKKAEEIQKQYNLFNKRIILFVGRLEVTKCPDLLLKTFHKIESSKDILIIVGQGSLSNYLLNYIKENQINNVILTGRLTGENLYAWYYLANVFILPSKFEPFGAVVNEALVAGCYTIVSDKVGAAALIDKHNGMVIQISSFDTFKNKFINCLKNIPIKKVHKSLMNKSFSQHYNDLRKNMEI